MDRYRPSFARLWRRLGCFSLVTETFCLVFRVSAVHSIEIVRRYHFISTRSLIQPVILTFNSVVPKRFTFALDIFQSLKHQTRFQANNNIKNETEER